MLYRLEVENFYSIRDRQVLDLTIAPNVPDLEGRFAPVFPGSELRAPKVVAVYGANASGKTTVLRALSDIIGFISQSATNGLSGFTMVRFNDEESKSRPIKLALEFGAIMDLSPTTDPEVAVKGVMRYELEIDVVNGQAMRVRHESLRQKPLGRGKWQRVFERNIDGEVLGSSSFKISGYQHLQNTLKENASVLSSFAYFAHPTAEIYVQATINVLSIFEPVNNDQSVINFLANNTEVLDSLNRDLGRIDVGIESLRFDMPPSGPIAMFKHSGLDLEMGWNLESQGTRGFIRLFPLLAMTLQNGGIGIVDEFDTYIHPTILPEILCWFYDARRNQHNSQIWLSSHTPTLMDSLEKEEIVIAQKDQLGRTTIYSLMDLKDVRRDDNLSKKYLGGAYGGVPVIG
jgi:uncharacterized protein